MGSKFGVIGSADGDRELDTVQVGSPIGDRVKGLLAGIGRVLHGGHKRVDKVIDEVDGGNEKPLSFELTEEQKEMLKYLFPSGIEFSHLSQSSDIGDCYLLAVLHPLKRHPLAPYIFADMIRRDGDKWYLKSSVGTEYEVDDSYLNSSGIEYYDQELKRNRLIRQVSGQRGDRLFEAAWGKRRKELPEYKNQNQGHPMTMQVVNAGNMREVQASLLAQYIDANVKIEPDDHQSIDRLLRDFDYGSRKYLITVCTRDHAWTVISCNPDKREFTIADPHDSEGQLTTLTYDEFSRRFHGMYYARFKQEILDEMVPYEDDRYDMVPEGRFGEELPPHTARLFDFRGGATIEIGDYELSCQIADDGAVEILFGEASFYGGGIVVPVNRFQDFRFGTNDFKVLSSQISRRQLTIRNLGDGKLIITDLGSTNGTIINRAGAEALQYEEEQEKGQEGDEDLLIPNVPQKVAFGEYGFRIGIADLEIGVYERHGELCVRLDDVGPCARTLYVMEGEPATIVGRSGSLDDLDSQISGEHFSIEYLGKNRRTGLDEVLITDLNSTNGTKILD